MKYIMWMLLGAVAIAMAFIYTFGDTLTSAILAGVFMLGATLMSLPKPRDNRRPERRAQCPQRRASDEYWKKHGRDPWGGPGRYAR